MKPSHEILQLPELLRISLLTTPTHRWFSEGGQESGVDFFVMEHVRPVILLL